MQGFKLEFNMFLHVFFAMGPDAVDQVHIKILMAISWVAHSRVTAGLLQARVALQ